MKLAIVGCGALGSFYGAKLCRAGHDVHFLLRSDYDAVREHGVTVRSPDGDFQVRPHCARTPEEIGRCDAVLIALKTTANDQFPKLLPPLVAPHTAVITLQNGLGNEEQLARLFVPEQVFGGLCYVCLNRAAPGVIHGFGRGKVVLGKFQRPPGSRAQELVKLFCEAGVKCVATDNLARTHWEKLIWNIPFNGLGVAGTAGYEALHQAQREVRPLTPVLPTDALLGDPRWAALVRELMHEVIAAANALGLNVAPELAEQQIERTLTLGAYRASTLIDFERGQPLELESMFLEPLRQAQAAGVATPRLARLCEVLQRLDPAAGTQSVVSRMSV